MQEELIANRLETTFDNKHAIEIPKYRRSLSPPVLKLCLGINTPYKHAQKTWRKHRKKRWKKPIARFTTISGTLEAHIDDCASP